MEDGKNTHVTPKEIYPNTKIESFTLVEGDTKVPRDIMVEDMVIINKSHSSDMKSQTKVVKEYLSKLDKYISRNVQLGQLGQGN
jgi:hypothetical protein